MVLPCKVCGKENIMSRHFVRPCPSINLRDITPQMLAARTGGRKGNVNTPDLIAEIVRQRGPLDIAALTVAYENFHPNYLNGESIGRHVDITVAWGLVRVDNGVVYLVRVDSQNVPR